MKNRELTGSSLPGDAVSDSSITNADFLRRKARWIRDELDPQVAREGPDALHSDELLTLDEFLRRLLKSNIDLAVLRYSRIHLAVTSIAGRATRWPKRLIDRCEALETAWETAHGPLKHWGTLLYEPGGRLHGICKPEDTIKEKLMIEWLQAPGKMPSSLVARRHGDLGFKPGDWWINPLFAFRDGIIDIGERDGGITADTRSAYALVMNDGDEVTSSSPEEFIYRAKEHDRGRYRLTACTPESRQPIRVLRSHSLRSFWSPRAGLRYDGLCVRSKSPIRVYPLLSRVLLNEIDYRYRVTGWSMKADPDTKAMVYEIACKRLSSEVSMDSVLCRPWADEFEDYKEYKRLRQIEHEKRIETARAQQAKKTPELIISTDGARDMSEDNALCPPLSKSDGKYLLNPSLSSLAAVVNISSR